MSNSSTLQTSLYNLFLRVQEGINTLKDNREFSKVPYEEIPATNIDYHKGNFQPDWANVKRYEIYEWKSQVFSNFLEKDVKRLAEYNSAVAAICSKFNIPEHAKHIGISHYVSYLMHRIPNNSVNESNIEVVINTFIRDFQIGRTDNLYTWNVELWLAKFEFEGDILSIAENVILRKPTASDLAERRPVRNFEDEFEKFTGRGLPVGSIVEFSMKAPVQNIGLYSDLIREEMEKWIDIFRLFKVGSIYPVYQSIYPDSIIHGGTTEQPTPPFYEGWEYKIDNQDKGSYGYMIGKDEIPLFIQFVSKLKPILKNISLKSYLQGNNLNLAFHKYKDALLKSNMNIDKITSAIGSLEALLSGQPGEISYRISLYVSILLRFLGFNNIKVYEKVRYAYVIRSQVVHGSKLDEDMLKFTRKHTHEIVNYARLCLLISLQLREVIGKDEFAKKLNLSLIDAKTNDELGELIRKNVYIPIVYPFLKQFNPEGDEVTG